MSSSGDSLVYELSLETEGTKEPFVRQDWISILDNQGTNYQSFQSVIDTSQLSNSDKWMNYREAFFLIPLLLTAQGTTPDAFFPATPGMSVDNAIGLKNWYGSVINSISVDLNGTTIIQQTQLINLINSFRLLTTFSWGDVRSIGSSIGFYPDDVDSISFSANPNGAGQGFCNNGTLSAKLLSSPVLNQVVPTGSNTFASNKNPTSFNNILANETLSTVLNPQTQQFQNCYAGGPNEGFIKRNQWLTFDTDGLYSFSVTSPIVGTTASASITPSDPTIASGLTGVTPSNLPVGAIIPCLSTTEKLGTTPGGACYGLSNAFNAPGSASTNITFSQVMSQTSVNQLWKGSICQKRNGATAAGAPLPLWQTQTMAKVFLKHIHPFFQKVPLTKGVFMRFTMYFNCCSVTVSATPSVAYGTAAPYGTGIGAGSVAGTPTSTTSGVGGPLAFNVLSINAPINGTVPIMIASGQTVTSNLTEISQPCALAIADSTSYTWANSLFMSTTLQQGDVSVLGSNAARGSILQPLATNAGQSQVAGFGTKSLIVNLSVGYKCLDNQITNSTNGPLGQSVQLVLPAYTMNPVFEGAYLTNPIKNIKYIDYFQYTTPTLAPTNNFNNLITNGIAGLREIVIFPMLAPNQSSAGSNTYPWTSTGVQQFPQYQNPFDSCGGGTMLPLSMMTQFNVLLSGQNMSYSTIRYSYEEFTQQFYGRSGAVNAGLTDGITSGLIDEHMWEMGYGAYYLDLSRMLAVEDSVPKSVSIQGTIKSNFSVQFVVFLGFEVSIGMDVLTGARV